MNKQNQFQPNNDEKFLDELANIYQSVKEKVEIERIVLKTINQTDFTRVSQKQTLKIRLMQTPVRVRFASAFAVVLLAITSIFYFVDFGNNGKNNVTYINDTVNSPKQEINYDKTQDPIIKDNNLIVYQF